MLTTLQSSAMTRSAGDRPSQENQLHLQKQFLESCWEGKHRLQERNDGQNQQSQPIRAPCSGPSRLCQKGGGMFPTVRVKLLCTDLHGKDLGKQQHLVRVPEESSDCVAWRILGCRALMLDPGPQGQRVRPAPTLGEDE